MVDVGRERSRYRPDLFQVASGVLDQDHDLVGSVPFGQVQSRHAGGGIVIPGLVALLLIGLVARNGAA